MLYVTPKDIDILEPIIVEILHTLASYDLSYRQASDILEVAKERLLDAKIDLSV